MEFATAQPCLADNAVCKFKPTKPSGGPMLKAMPDAILRFQNRILRAKQGFALPWSKGLASVIPFKVFDIFFLKNSILNFLEPLYVVDLIAAVRLVSKSKQVRFSKPLWWKAFFFWKISLFFLSRLSSRPYMAKPYMARPYGKALWPSHMTKPYGKAIWELLFWLLPPKIWFFMIFFSPILSVLSVWAGKCPLLSSESNPPWSIYPG